jgi:uncharacterized UBP type Zn finger protein
VVAVTCAHVDTLPAEVTPDSTEGCKDCLDAGHHDWVHLRICLSCGHIGCCDSSPARHATAHFKNVGHPIIQSFEKGEDWRGCYSDEEPV